MPRFFRRCHCIFRTRLQLRVLADTRGGGKKSENDRHLSWGYILIPSNAIRAIERIRYNSAYAGHCSVRISVEETSNLVRQYLILSKDVTSHIHDVAKVLSVLKDAGTSLKLRKCTFVKQDVEYMGQIVKPGELRMDPKKTTLLAESKPPMEMVNVFRRLVQGFTNIAGPLTNLLRRELRRAFLSLAKSSSLPLRL